MVQKQFVAYLNTSITLLRLCKRKRTHIRTFFFLFFSNRIAKNLIFTRSILFKQKITNKSKRETYTHGTNIDFCFGKIGVHGNCFITNNICQRGCGKTLSRRADVASKHIRGCGTNAHGVPDGVRFPRNFLTTDAISYLTM